MNKSDSPSWKRAAPRSADNLQLTSDDARESAKVKNQGVFLHPQIFRAVTIFSSND